MEFTDKEKIVLKLMLNIINTIIETQGGYLDINNDTFSRNDLYDLEQKLGIDYLY